MYRLISGTAFILATAACITALPSEAAAQDPPAFANKPETGTSPDQAIDAAKGVSRKPKPRVRYSVPPRKKVEGAPRRYSLALTRGQTS
jgi:hypothetical protein